MNKSQFRSRVPYSARLNATRGQGLVEYAILITLVGVVAILGLTLAGGSVEGGFIKVCSGLGVEDCQAVQSETAIASTIIPTLPVSPTPTLVPTATATLQEPDPTRPPALTALPIATALPITPVPTIELKTLRIKVVLTGGGKKSSVGIQVVVRNAAGEYVTQGVTDDKGEISFSVVNGNYMVATFYNNVWQNDGPFAVDNSKQNVIHR